MCYGLAAKKLMDALMQIQMSLGSWDHALQDGLLVVVGHVTAVCCSCVGSWWQAWLTQTPAMARWMGPRQHVIRVGGQYHWVDGMGFLGVFESGWA